MPRAKPPAKKTPAKRAARKPRPKAAEPEDLTVAGAVKRDLEEIAARDPSLASSTLAMSALRLAREMDTGDNSATSKSMCAKALLDTMDRLRELAPPPAKEDGIDELANRRARRRAPLSKGSARAKTQKRP